MARVEMGPDLGQQHRELPVKTGLGKVVWETAQAADVLGLRLPELRCGKKAVRPHHGRIRVSEFSSHRGLRSVLTDPKTPQNKRDAGLSHNIPESVSHCSLVMIYVVLKNAISVAAVSTR